ncbi:MAG TPA: hypothetical protein VLA79_18880 [Polyangia bacterium]|nr:hypothetical protein [Polyangia bacterium]
MSIGRASPLVCACAVYVATLGLWAGRARAALFIVSLDYDGGPGCPDAQYFEGIVRARLGYDPFSEAAPDHVFVRITPRIDAIDGHIEWRDATGRWAGDQTLPVVTKDCRNLVRTLAAALAVQIQLLAMTRDPAAGTTAPKSTGPPPEVTVTQPASQSPVARPSSDEPSAPPAAILETNASAPGTARDPHPAWAMGAGTAVGFGMSSTPVLLGRVIGAVAWRHVSLELAAEASLPSTARRSDGAGFSQQHLLASAAACTVLTRWRACLLANAGEVRLAGEDIDLPTSAIVPLVQAGARIGIVQALGRHLFVDAHADGLANVIRWTGTLDQVPVWTAPRLAAVVGLDLGAHVR